jgi:hypothetical protein
LEPYVDSLENFQVEPVRRQIKEAVEAYPELAGQTVTVGRMPDDVDAFRDAYAQADPYNRLILLPVGEVPPNVTIFHELAHLLIYQQHWDGQNVPHTSEEYCSLVAVARMAPGLIYADHVPYFGEPEVPRDEWPEIAGKALAYREENGANSHYVQFARERFGGGR